MAKSSDTVREELCRVFAGGRAAILSGNLGDFHVGPDGAIVGHEQLIAFAAAATARGTVVWSPARGTRQVTPPGRASVRFDGPGPSHDVPASLHRLVQELDRADHPTLLVIDWVSAALGRPDDPVGIIGELLCNAATDPTLARAGHRLCIVDRGRSAARVLGVLPGMRPIDVPLPNLDERLAFLLHLDCVHRSPGLAEIGEHDTIEGVALAANGMSLRALHALMGELRHAGRALGVDALLPVKRDFVLQHTMGALRMVDGNNTLDDIAGLHNIKLLIEHQVATPNLPMRHIVLAGPPGTGKGTVASALGPALGRTPVALGRVHDRWVGASEERMQDAISTAEQMAPALMFVDEMDQILKGEDGPSGDSGANERVNAMFWGWTGRVGPDVGVLVVGATNRPESLGERVHDRFTVVPVLHPDPTEATDIVRITAARAGRQVDLAGVVELLTAQPTPLSGRTLAELVDNSAGFADRAAGRRVDVIDAASMRSAVADLMPSIAAGKEQLMGLQAVRYTRRRSLLPWNAARARGVGYVVPPYLTGLVDATGDVDIAALDARIAELRLLA